MSVRMKVTIVGYYDANPKYYDTAEPAEMARVDRGNIERDPGLAVDLISDEEIDVTVEPL